MKTIISVLMATALTVALSFAFFIGCVSPEKENKVNEQQYAPIADYACQCTNATWLSIVTNEVISIEDIGERYVVETHHYYPEGLCISHDGTCTNKIQIEVMVGYQKQYLREGEPTDTSISNKTCFCGGPWEFTTNGYFRCERITSRTGMNCGKCGGYEWWTNVTTRVKTNNGENDGGAQ